MMGMPMKLFARNRSAVRRRAADSSPGLNVTWLARSGVREFFTPRARGGGASLRRINQLAGFRPMLKQLLYISVSAAAVSKPSFAQQRATHYEVGVGMIAQQRQLGVRSGVGASATFSAGRQLTRGISVRGTAAAAAFGRPDPWGSTAACSSFVPCPPPPSPSRVRVATLGTNAEYVASRTGLEPIVFGGIGIRYLTESPQRGADTRPYMELGCGAAFRRWTLRVRYEAARPGSDLPKWMMPAALGFRF
jgi:hypothetical protein